MRLQDIMQRNVETIAPQDSVVMANELMWRKSIHHLVVVDGGKVVGILSDTDLGGDKANEIPDNQRVSSVMSSQAIVAEPTMTVDRAMHIFEGRQLHCLPILDGGKLVGIVTATDIMNLAKRGVPNTATGKPYPPLNSMKSR